MGSLSCLFTFKALLFLGIIRMFILITKIAMCTRLIQHPLTHPPIAFWLMLLFDLCRLCADFVQTLYETLHPNLCMFAYPLKYCWGHGYFRNGTWGVDSAILVIGLHTHSPYTHPTF